MIKVERVITSLIVVWLGVLFSIGIVIPQNSPQRIISLGPAITQHLYLLGVQDKLVACTIYCKRPEEAKNKEKIGSLLEINVEKVVTLNPDLILATSLTPVRTVEKLKKLGLKVITFPSPKSFTQLCDQFLKLGKLTNKEKVAEQIIKETKQEIKKLKKEIKKKSSKPRVIVQLGTKPLWVATRNSLINDFIEFAGGINLGPKGEKGLFSREEVVRRNPDVIIIVEMGLLGEDEKKIWQKYKPINAVKNDRIYIMDAYKLCSPTVANFDETLKEIIKILHPEGDCQK